MKSWKKNILLVMAANHLAMLIYPTVMFALPGGPTQPEFASFQAADTAGMVDPFTGDFSYNIPIMHVPGPGGGYPINLSYASGISADMEASWVGLGWSINPGTINRNIRGIPDDFSGQFIEQELSMKDDISYGINGGVSGLDEVFGGEIDVNIGLNLGYSYNTYSGASIQSGLNLSSILGSPSSSEDPSLFANTNIGADSQSGLSFNNTLGSSYSHISSQHSEHVVKSTIGLNVNLQSNGAKKDIGVISSYDDQNFLDYNYSNNYGSYIPRITSERIGTNKRLNLSLSANTGGVDAPDFSLTGFYNTQTIKSNFQKLRAFGYLYDHLNIDIAERTLTDFNVESGLTPSKHVPTIAPAYRTHDNYYLSGQGISGTIRPFRSDMGFVSPTIAESRTESSNNGLDVAAGALSGKIGVTASNGSSESYSGRWRMPQATFSLPNVLNIPGVDLNPSLIPELTVSNHMPYSEAMLEPNLSLYKTRARTDSYNPLFEPFYFAQIDEKTYTSISDIENQRPFEAESFGVEKEWLGTSAQPVAVDNPQHSGHFQKERKSRNQFYGHRTIEEAVAQSEESQIRILKENGSTETLETHLVNLGLTGDYNKECIAQIYVVNDQGMRYEYGLPVYSLEENEVVFNFSEDLTSYSLQDVSERIFKNYNNNDISVSNDNGADNYFFHQKLPAYAHSYLITAIYSNDYVDLTGNGPSPDDFGTYTKFNYVRLSDKFGWKSPYGFNRGMLADFMPGYLSNYGDDKGNIKSGIKEVYFLKSIETKTHIAEFQVNKNIAIQEINGLISDGTRLDNLGATNLPFYEPNDLDNYSHYLTKIILYKKVDPFQGASSTNLEKLQVTHFAYSYELCRKYEANSKTQSASASANENFGAMPNFQPNDYQLSGKLTLKRVWSTFGEYEEKEMNVYAFEYVDDQDALVFQNPDFSFYNLDRWGNVNFNDPNYDGLEARVNPYTLQRADVNFDNLVNDEDKNIRNALASAWSLRKIHTPGGGTVQIAYESDDYKFIQNEQAMQMSKIVGMSTSMGVLDAESYNNVDLTGNSSSTRSRLYFELNNPFEEPQQEEIVEAFKGQEYLYFKVFMRLMRKDIDNDSQNDLEDANDYVEGWAKIKMDSGDPICGWSLYNGLYYGFVDVELTSFRQGSLVPNAIEQMQVTHPFRFAGWQNLKALRPDLLNENPNPNGGISAEMFLNLIDLLPEVTQMTLGYYQFAKSKGYCANLDLSKPSYIRINAYSRGKFGGGHRVSRITMNDNWSQVMSDELDGITGIDYLYVLEDGVTSSGVASYEPMSGGEENPFRQPVLFNGNESHMNLKFDQAFYELPDCESQMPSPQVGYSRVVQVKHRAVDNAYRNSEGIEVQHFYTAKHFPTVVRKTDMDVAPYNVNVPIPLIGNYVFNNNGYSQGFCVILNDMHGKPRRVETYPYLGQDLVNSHIHSEFFDEIEPALYTEYNYRTIHPFNENLINRLSNKVEFLESDNEVIQGYIGLTCEHHLYQEQNSSYAVDAGGNAQLNVVGIAVVPTAFPKYAYSESVYRSITYLKVVYQSGIVESTTSFNEGQKIAAMNLYYSKVNGAPLLSTVENNFGKPIYNYSIPGFWHYSKLGQCSVNEGARFYVFGNDESSYSSSNLQGISSPESGVLQFHPDMFKPTTTAKDYFLTGDVIQSFPDGKKYWVQEVEIQNSANSEFRIRLKDEDDEFPTFSNLSALKYFKIIKSGNQNQSSILVGDIIALDNPIDIQTPFDFLNNIIESGLGIVNGYSTSVITNCGNVLDFEFTENSSGNIQINISDQNGNEYSLDITNLEWKKPTNHGLFVNDLSSIDLTLDANNNIAGTGIPDGSSSPINLEMTYTEEISTDEPCPVGVLQASAVTYTDNWINKLTLGSSLINDWIESDNFSIARFESNPYRYGILGIPRLHNTYVFQNDREQLNFDVNISKTNVQRDGLFNEFYRFNWMTPSASETQYWTKKNEATLYNPYGHLSEEKNALNIPSAMLVGYNNDLPISICSNAVLNEIAFQGFEDYNGVMLLDGNHGSFSQFPLLNENVVNAQITTESHSGRFAAVIPNETVYRIDLNGSSNPFIPEIMVNYGLSSQNPAMLNAFIPNSRSGKFVFTGWFKVNESNDLPNITIKRTKLLPQQVTVLESISSDASNVVSDEIEGWRKFEMIFEGPNSSSSGMFEISFNNVNGLIWDDMRIQPYNSSMVTYIYDHASLRLLAEHDERNFTTFYCYDELGALFQKKIETERGIQTVATQQNHILITH